MMTQRAPEAMVGQIRLAIDHFNRRSSAQALKQHGRADDSIRFEMERIVHLGSEVRTRGELVNRGEEIRLPLVLAWKLDPSGKLARIEAYPSGSDTATPLAATRKPGRRRFAIQDVHDMPVNGSGTLSV